MNDKQRAALTVLLRQLDNITEQIEEIAMNEYEKSSNLSESNLGFSATGDSVQDAEQVLQETVKKLGIISDDLRSLTK